MGELFAAWEQRGDLSSAILHPTNTCPALLLSVWLSPVDGLWRACTEYQRHYGSWAAPSGFVNVHLAQQWCEKRAEDIASTYPDGSFMCTVPGGQS